MTPETFHHADLDWIPHTPGTGSHNMATETNQGGTEMTNEQINIKIAELCGWKRHPQDQWIIIPPNALHSFPPLFTTPNYTADLNACHEFEKTLTPEQESAYWEHLLQAHEYIQPWAGCATARQRCEALLRVHGQWEETK